MRVIIQMTQEEYDELAAEHKSWGGELENLDVYIREVADVEDHIHDAQIQVVADMKAMLEDILKGL